MKDDWLIMFASPPHREELVAEVSFKGYQIAEIFRDGGRYAIVIRSNEPTGRGFMDPDEFIHALSAAISGLRERLD